jgi:hypothetical protein
VGRVGGDRRAGGRLRDQQQPGPVHIVAAAAIAAVITAVVAAVGQFVAVLRLLRQPVVGIARPPVIGVVGIIGIGGIVRPVEPQRRASAGRAGTAAMATATLAVVG